MAEVMKPGIRHDSGCLARFGPERPQVIRTQRPVSLASRKHPLAGCRFGESVQQLPRRASPSRTCLGPVFASIRVKRSGLNRRQHVRRRGLQGHALPPGTCNSGLDQGRHSQSVIAFELLDATEDIPERTRNPQPYLSCLLKILLRPVPVLVHTSRYCTVEVAVNEQNMPPWSPSTSTVYCDVKILRRLA